MKKVLTFGVFDYFHYGHLRLLDRCSKLGDYLIVAIQVDEEIAKNKPGVKIYYNYNQRKDFIDALRVVNETVPYTQVDETIKTIDFDVLVVGPDQTHEGFQRAFKWCEEHNKQVVVLERTPGISSTQLREGNK